MPLPEFNSHGLLPDGVHYATPDELRERCVDQFPRITTRAQVFANFLRFRHDLEKLGLSLTQWVDGSFVDQTRLDPADIDVVSFCDSELYSQFPDTTRERALVLLTERKITKPQYKIDSFLVIEFVYDHYMWGEFEKARRYWRKLFSQPLSYADPKIKRPDKRRGSKGIVQITLGDAKLCPRIDPSFS